MRGVTAVFRYWPWGSVAAELILGDSYTKDEKCTYSVTMSRLRATIVAVEKQ